MPTVELTEIDGLPTIRITCTCRDLGHHLDISFDEDTDSCFIEVNTREHSAFHWYGLEKLKAIWNILWNKPICLGGIVASKEDMAEISKFIERNL